MRLERLEIGGFMHFKEPAVLDLRDTRPGLVAVTGANGHGKTRLIDAGPGGVYGELPSRDGSIADYATERDAYIDNLFSIEGRGQYRVRFNVDGVSRKTDAVVEAINADGSATPLNDGKVTTFKDKIAEIFPPKDLLLASAFAAQNRAGSFVTLDRSKRKDLFGKLLGLEHYAAMAATAKQCLDVVETTRARLAERRDLLARDTSPAIADALQVRANALQVEGGQAELRRGELQDELEALTAERAELVDQATAHLTARERAEALNGAVAGRRADLARVDADREAADREAQGERTRADIRRGTAMTEIDGRERTETQKHAAAVKDLDERIANNRTVLADADHIRASVAAKAEAEQTVTQLRAQEFALRAELEADQHQIQERERRLATVTQQQAQLAEARRKLDTLRSVPCAGAGRYAACRFLTDATQAQASIPELEGAVAGEPELRTGIAYWTEKAAEHRTRLDATGSRIRSAEKLVAEQEPLAKLEPHIAAAEARIAEYERTRQQADADLQTRLADLEAQRARVEAQHVETFADIDRRLASRVEELTARRAEWQAAITAAEQALTVAHAEVQATEPAARRLVALDGDLEVARQAWTTNEATLAAVAARRAELERERQAFGQKCADLQSVLARLRTAEGRALIWGVFAKAFGRDGLPTLEIAAAGPTVSNLTNELLSVSFGARFTLEVTTQVPKADGKGLKEDFSIRIFDNEYGGEPRDIADLSGGERVVVEEAFRAALGLYVNSRNVAPIRTCWRDETTGALDPENAVRYIAMLRRMQELGGYVHVIFVTHNPDCAALADTQIVVKNGQPTIRSERAAA